MYRFINIVKFGPLIIGNSYCYISDILFFREKFFVKKIFNPRNSTIEIRFIIYDF